MELLGNGFVKLGGYSIIKVSKIQAIKPLTSFKEAQILLVVDGVAFTICYTKYQDSKANRQDRDEELLKLTNLLTTKQKKDN